MGIEKPIVLSSEVALFLSKKRATSLVFKKPLLFSFAVRFSVAVLVYALETF